MPLQPNAKNRNNTSIGIILKCLMVLFDVEFQAFFSESFSVMHDLCTIFKKIESKWPELEFRINLSFNW